MIKKIQNDAGVRIQFKQGEKPSEPVFQIAGLNVRLVLVCLFCPRFFSANSYLVIIIVANSNLFLFLFV